MSQSLAKTTDISALVSINTLANNSFSASSAYDVSTKFGVTVMMRIGRSVTTALTSQAKVVLQTSMKSSGGDTWVTLAEFGSSTAAATSSALAASGNGAGVTVLTASSSSSIASGTKVLVSNTTATNSEFARTAQVTGTSINVLDATTNSQNSSTVYDSVDEFMVDLDCRALTRIRVVFLNYSGQTIYIEARVVTSDSIG